MKKVYFLIIFVATLFTTSCNVVQVSTDHARNIDFSKYKTYGYHEKGLEKLRVNDLDKQRLIRAIDHELSEKGFVKTNDKPDLLLNLLTSYKNEINVVNDYWFDEWNPYLLNTPRINQYTTGTIIIDLIDNKENILIWQGIGSDLNVSNIDAKDVRIPQAINEILRQFPPKNFIK